MISACDVGRADSIHLAPERIDDYADRLVARDCVVGVSDVELDCHGDLAFVAGEVPPVEGNICGFHGWCLGVGFGVGLAVGFSGRFAVGRSRHSWMFVGGKWGFNTRARMG